MFIRYVTKPVIWRYYVVGYVAYEDFNFNFVADNLLKKTSLE